MTIGEEVTNLIDADLSIDEFLNAFHGLFDEYKTISRKYKLLKKEHDILINNFDKLKTEHNDSLAPCMKCHDLETLQKENLQLKDTVKKLEVHELHRLYRVQKMLMAELQNKEVALHCFASETEMSVADNRTRICSSASSSDTSHNSHVSNAHQSVACSRKASTEMSFCSQEPSSVQFKGFDREQPAEGCSPSVARTVKEQTSMHEKQLKESRSEGLLSWTDDGSEMELTLSIRCSPNKKKQTHSQHPCTDIGSREKGEECGDSSAGLESRNLKSSHWLLRAPNLNKT
ncbi:unnamed protein product [Musa acuminata subsp. burmannicoides]